MKRNMNFTPRASKKPDLSGSPMQVARDRVDNVKSDCEKLCDQFDDQIKSQLDFVGKNQPRLKDQAALMASMLAPMMKGMANMLSNLIQSKDKDFVTRDELNVSNLNMQGSFIEALYDRDRIECRQRYANLRITGFVENKETPIDSLIDFAAGFEVTLEKHDFQKVEDLKYYKGRGKGYLVSFASVHAREQFIEAKFNAIKEKARLRAVLLRNPDDAASKDKLDLLGRLHIDEDLTARRYKLVKVAKNAPGVKKVYTRNAVLHVVRDSDKVKIFSANDLYKLDIYDVPYHELDIPQRIIDMFHAPPTPSRVQAATRE